MNTCRSTDRFFSMGVHCRKTIDHGDGEISKYSEGDYWNRKIDFRFMKELCFVPKKLFPWVPTTTPERAGEIAFTSANSASIGKM